MMSMLLLASARLSTAPPSLARSAKLVSARAWLVTLQSEPMATCWLALVRPRDGQKESEGGEDQIGA